MRIIIFVCFFSFLQNVPNIFAEDGNEKVIDSGSSTVDQVPGNDPAIIAAARNPLKNFEKQQVLRVTGDVRPELLFDFFVLVDAKQNLQGMKLETYRLGKAGSSVLEEEWYWKIAEIEDRVPLMSKYFITRFDINWLENNGAIPFDPQSGGLIKLVALREHSGLLTFDHRVFPLEVLREGHKWHLASVYDKRTVIKGMHFIGRYKNEKAVGTQKIIFKNQSWEDIDVGCHGQTPLDFSCDLDDFPINE